MFFVYVLKSTKDKELYVGYTNDLKRRLKEHNNGENLSTKFRRPFILAYYEGYLSKKDAQEREKQLKRRGQARHHLKKRISDSLLDEI